MGTAGTSKGTVECGKGTATGKGRMQKKNDNRCGNIAVVSLRSMDPEFDNDQELDEQPRMVVSYVLGGCAIMSITLLVMFVIVIFTSFDTSTYGAYASLGFAGVVIVGVFLLLARADRRSRTRGLFAGALIALGIGALIFGLCVAVMQK